jgi:hypothetical protein
MTMGGRVADAPFRRRVAAVKTDNREEVDLAMMAMHSGKEQNKGREDKRRFEGRDGKGQSQGVMRVNK